MTYRAKDKDVTHLWYGDTESVINAVVAHCDKKMDAYHADKKKADESLRQKVIAHNRQVDRYLSNMETLVKLLGKRVK